MAAENQVQFETARVARRVLTKFREDLSAPELYLEPSQSVRDDCLSAVEMLFRCLRQAAGPLPVGPLQQLYTAEFDKSQVWEEVQLTNEPALAYLEHVLRGLGPGMQLVARDAEEEQQKEEEETEEEEREDKAEEEGEWEEEEQLEGGDEADVGEKSRSRFDDGFFSLAAMERYLEEADQLSDPGSEGSVGMLAIELSDSGSDQLLYQDFFDPPLVAGRVEDENQLSTYERKKVKMALQIQAIEEVNVQPKPWQMSGETGSHDRPLNSLLEEAVDFDPMTVPAPVVSEETTHSIEEIIKQRILDQAWDDVQRKVKPPEKPYNYQRARPLEQEKSQRSLAEVYEADYLQQTAQEGMPTETGKVGHTEIENLKNILFLKLDALTNFHFTPKPPHSEPCVVSNVSAVVMEEVVPSAVAQHTLLAPEEVQAKSLVPERGESERTQADRRRQRVAKKRLKRKRGKQVLPRLAARTRQDKNFRKSSSHRFFTSLQETLAHKQ